MPAVRIGDDNVDIAELDALGFDSEGQAAFVSHVALTLKAFSGAPPVSVRIAHMMPPFHSPSRSFSDVSCFGGAELTDDEQKQIAEFIQELIGEYKAEEARRKATGAWGADAKEKFHADQYAIRPAVAGPTLDRPYHQLSCAGFVHEAYANADLTLLTEDETAWPHVDMPTLKEAYPSAVDHLDDPDFCASKGLTDGDRWPVLLPGYILHALARPRSEIETAPYQPAPGDEIFNPDETELEPGSGGKK